jgi:hypothetical protein
MTMMMEFGGEFYHLKRRPGYPSVVEAVAIAHLYFDRDELCLYFDRPPGFQWVASLWIVDGSCEVDLALVLKEGRLDFIEGYCCHGDFCPKVEELKRAVLESPAFSQVREDLIYELFQRSVAGLNPIDRPLSPQTVPPEDEDRDRWPRE